MEEIMQSNTYFIVPLTLAYGSICGLWFLLNSSGNAWEITLINTPAKPGKEFILALLAAIGILLIGQVYSAGYLIPRTGSIYLNYLIWPLNNILIFSPIILFLIMRKQGLNTIFISGTDFWKKIGFGIVTSLAGILLFLALRGEIGRLQEIATNAIRFKTLSNFPAIFFENIALAFLFVRLKWVTNIRWAIAIPSILFAFAHIPGSIAEGDPWSHIVIFFFLTGSLTTFILYTAFRSRDIIWLGVVHYMMDVAIKAF